MEQTIVSGTACSSISCPLLSGLSDAPACDAPQEGLAVLRKMELAGVPPNEVTFTTLIDGFTRTGDLQVPARRSHSPPALCSFVCCCIIPSSASLLLSWAGVSCCK